MDDRERWRNIKDFPGYRVSSRGRVKNNLWGYWHVKVRVVETGEIFDSEADCARALGISQPNICGCLLHKYGRHTCNGFHFEYVDE